MVTIWKILKLCSGLCWNVIWTITQSNSLSLVVYNSCKSGIQSSFWWSKIKAEVGIFLLLLLYICSSYIHCLCLLHCSTLCKIKLNLEIAKSKLNSTLSWKSVITWCTVTSASENGCLETPTDCLVVLTNVNKINARTLTLWCFIGQVISTEQWEWYGTFLLLWLVHWGLYGRPDGILRRDWKIP